MGILQMQVDFISSKINIVSLTCSINLGECLIFSVATQLKVNELKKLNYFLELCQAGLKYHEN